jgi:hypothetical protein
MYSSSEYYKVVLTWVLGSPMAQQNMENKEQNHISAKPKINLFTYGLVHYCVFMGYRKWVEQFVIVKLYNELKQSLSP